MEALDYSSFSMKYPGLTRQQSRHPVPASPKSERLQTENDRLAVARGHNEKCRLVQLVCAYVAMCPLGA